MTTIATPLPRTKAPVARLLHSEQRRTLRTPRNLVSLGLPAAIPGTADTATEPAATGGPR
ncbi:hypothetical protein Actkin_00770 [Actinokineospora sp. UTMC 2448]|nr:hypothetical protein Actkin_00770 [Actinokineospora sp. UTMC 2448]